MGRWKKNYKPVITEENKALADEYLQVISKHYEEYLELFSNMFENGEDIVGETLLKTHKTISHKGLKTVIGKQGQEREQIFKNYFFISAKLNCLTEQQNIQKQYAIKNLDHNPFEDMDTEEKIKSQIYKDFKVMYIVQLVETNFDVIDYRCFRLYHLLKNMTYAKLKDMTGIRNCKTRVVRINKWLKETIDEQEIRQSFIEQYPDFS